MRSALFGARIRRRIVWNSIHPYKRYQSSPRPFFLTRSARRLPQPEIRGEIEKELHYCYKKPL